MSFGWIYMEDISERGIQCQYLHNIYIYIYNIYIYINICVYIYIYNII